MLRFGICFPDQRERRAVAVYIRVFIDPLDVVVVVVVANQPRLVVLLGRLEVRNAGRDDEIGVGRQWILHNEYILGTRLTSRFFVGVNGAALRGDGQLSLVFLERDVGCVVADRLPIQVELAVKVFV